MIRLNCPGCGVKIKAKLELAGKTRKCPKCGGIIVVPRLEELPEDVRAEAEAEAALAGSPAVKPQTAESAANGAAAVPAEIIQANPAETLLPTSDLPDRLNRRHRYLILDKSGLLAMWQDNGQGWMVKGVSGFMPARRNAENLLPYGQFILVELELELTDAGMRLQAITSYKLAARFALPKLALGDDDIMLAVTEPGCLSREQKNAVRKSLTEQFMREVWGDSPGIVEYLGNADYHSPTSRANIPGAENAG